MTSDDQLREKIVHLTTYDADGVAGTVAMWFYPANGKIYMSSGINSVKTRRIARNPAVGLQFGSRSAPMVQGKASVATDPSTIRLASEGLYDKYEGGGVWWNSLENMVSGFLRQSPSVLLEITLD